MSMFSADINRSAGGGGTTRVDGGMAFARLRTDGAVWPAFAEAGLAALAAGRLAGRIKDSDADGRVSKSGGAGRAVMRRY